MSRISSRSSLERASVSLIGCVPRDISIMPEAPDKHSDASVLPRVRRGLRTSPYPAIRKLECEFERGVLTLRGELPSYYQLQLAQEAVSRVDGVEQIVNRIQVQSPDSR
jgi:osmotically-inducible protein OsmY